MVSPSVTTWGDEGTVANENYCQDLPSQPQPQIGKILVTGATGYVGGRLVPELLARGYSVRILVRAFSPELQDRWPGVEIAVGDALRYDTLIPALQGVHTAYYLIHSLLVGPKRFERFDLQAAANFRQAADQNQVHRIIYLGGLGDRQSRLSSHLRSRQAVGSELKRGNALVTVLRAAIIIGSGSASFEMIENLIRRLPVVVLPTWASTRCQPIAIRNVIMYLVGVLETPETAGRSYDIGGPDIMSYHEMLSDFAEVLGLRRLFVPFFISNIRILSYLASLLTPVPHSMVRCLLESAANTVVCLNHDIRTAVPIHLLHYREALLRALSREDQDRIYTRWSDAYPPAHELAMRLTEMSQAKLYTTSASLETRESPAALFHSICRVGGKEGWFSNNWLWKLRGMLDRVLMGVGTSRGRRHSTLLRINDVVDFWRVEDVQPERRLLLRAEMKLPGRAWLEFLIDPAKEGLHTLTVNAYYQPNGFWGKVYWVVVYPLHHIVFTNLIEQIEKCCRGASEFE